MIQNVTKSCRELAKYVRIKETLLNAAGVARGPRAGGTRGEGGQFPHRFLPNWKQYLWYQLVLLRAK